MLCSCIKTNNKHPAPHGLCNSTRGCAGSGSVSHPDEPARPTGRGGGGGGGSALAVARAAVRTPSGCRRVLGILGVAPTEAHPCAVAGARVHGCWAGAPEPWDGSHRGPCIARGGAVLVRGAWAQSKTPREVCQIPGGRTLSRGRIETPSLPSDRMPLPWRLVRSFWQYSACDDRLVRSL